MQTLPLDLLAISPMIQSSEPEQQLTSEPPATSEIFEEVQRREQEELRRLEQEEAKRKEQEERKRGSRKRTGENMGGGKEKAAGAEKQGGECRYSN